MMEIESLADAAKMWTTECAVWELQAVDAAQRLDAGPQTTHVPALTKLRNEGLANLRRILTRSLPAGLAGIPVEDNEDLLFRTLHMTSIICQPTYPKVLPGVCPACDSKAEAVKRYVPDPPHLLGIRPELCPCDECLSAKAERDAAALAELRQSWQSGAEWRAENGRPLLDFGSYYAERLAGGYAGPPPPAEELDRMPDAVPDPFVPTYEPVPRHSGDLTASSTDPDIVALMTPTTEEEHQRKVERMARLRRAPDALGGWN